MNAAIINRLNALGANVSRRLFGGNGPGVVYDGVRDIATACGYKAFVSPEDYVTAYATSDIGARVIEVYPDYTWKEPPQIIERVGSRNTRFEKQWETLVDETQMFSHFRDLDVLAGIGRYGLLVIGVDDGRKLHTELTPSPDNHIIYMRAYMEAEVVVRAYESDTSSPRYGLPILYKVTPYDISQDGIRSTAAPVKGDAFEVHYTRTLHFADNAVNSEVFGVPRLARVYNRLTDIMKIVGGSAEMFWRGAYQGFSFEADADSEMTPEAKEDAKEQIDKYIQGLDRKLLLQGVKTRPLSPAISSPLDHLDAQLTMISIATGIPKRALMGSEIGKLSSTQDSENWSDRVKARQKNIVEPKIVRKFIKWAQTYEILSTPASNKYTVFWVPLRGDTTSDRADTAYTLTKAFREYCESTLHHAIDFKTYLLTICHFSLQDAEDAMAGFDEGKLNAIEKENKAMEQDKMKAKSEGAGKSSDEPGSTVIKKRQGER